MICPEHNVEMNLVSTRYGGLSLCPVYGCDMRCWAGETSTPADKPTRDARMAAHDSFDGIWKSGQIKRQDAYNRLSEHLELPLKDTHIGQFDVEMCGKVIEFAEALPMQILKDKFGDKRTQTQGL